MESKIKNYIRHGGKLCLFCSADTLNGGLPHVYPGGKITQEIFCTTCECSWFDTYKLTGIKDFLGPNTVDPYI